MTYFNSKINLNPKFLIGLGNKFLDKNLLDEASEILSKFKKGESFYTDALCGLMEVNSHMGNSLEVIRIGEELLNDGLDEERNLYFSGMVAGAYSKLGKFSDATPFLMKSLAFLPDNELIQKGLLEIPKGSDRPQIKPLLRAKGAKQLGLTPHLIFDCIAPLLWGARSTTCCFPDQFPWFPKLSINESKLTWYLLSMYLYSVSGIYTAFYKYFDAQGPIGKIYFSKKDTIFDEVSEIERITFEEFENRGKIMTPQTPETAGGMPLNSMIKEGILLGYPNCCIEWAVNMRKDNASFEKQALVSLITEEYVSSLEESKTFPPEFAYFTSEFYPCHPRCANAENIGMTIYQQYDKNDKDLSRFFKNHFLQNNKAKIITTGEEMRRKWDELAANFNYKLENIAQSPWQKFQHFSEAIFLKNWLSKSVWKMVNRNPKAIGGAKAVKKAERDVEECAKAHPDFYEYYDLMMEIAGQQPSLRAEDVYQLAKARSKETKKQAKKTGD